MATTSSTLAAGTAMAGRSGNGSGSKRHLAATMAAAALGLSLLVGGLTGQGRPAARPAVAPEQRANPYWVYQEDVAITGDVAAAAMALGRVSPYWTYQEDVTLNGNPAEAAMTALRVNPYWTYEEDVVLNGNPAQVAFPFAPDQFTHREDRRER